MGFTWSCGQALFLMSLETLPLPPRRMKPFISGRLWTPRLCLIYRLLNFLSENWMQRGFFHFFFPPSRGRVDGGVTGVVGAALEGR